LIISEKSSIGGHSSIRSEGIKYSLQKAVVFPVLLAEKCRDGAFSGKSQFIDGSLP
jgi:hypothetical protein